MYIAIAIYQLYFLCMHGDQLLHLHIENSFSTYSVSISQIANYVIIINLIILCISSILLQLANYLKLMMLICQILASYTRFKFVNRIPFLLWCQILATSQLLLQQQSNDPCVILDTKSTDIVLIIVHVVNISNQLHSYKYIYSYMVVYLSIIS